MFSILIPSYNNLSYLKLCIKSIIDNSKFNHQIIVHVNEGTDGTLNYLKESNIDFTFTNYNSGICEGINKASKLAKNKYFVYAHDDFYFCPKWDEYLDNEIKKINHNNFYLSGTMMNKGQIPFDCGQNVNEFNEYKFLNEYKNYNFYDFQGSTWAPTLVHKEIWNKVGGFSEEFFPGTGSDPDFNMKLWKIGVRQFKGLSGCRVYHFSSVSLRKKTWNDGAKIFLLKWKISIKFFKKHYLRSGRLYDGLLKEPEKKISFYFDFALTKIKYFYTFLLNLLKVYE